MEYIEYEMPAHILERDVPENVGVCDTCGMADCPIVVNHLLVGPMCTWCAELLLLKSHLFEHGSRGKGIRYVDAKRRVRFEPDDLLYLVAALAAVLPAFIYAFYNLWFA